MTKALQVHFAWGRDDRFKLATRGKVWNVPDWGDNWESVVSEQIAPWVVAASDIRIHGYARINTKEGRLLDEFVRASFCAEADAHVWDLRSDLTQHAGARFFWAETIGMPTLKRIGFFLASVTPVSVFELNDLSRISPYLRMFKGVGLSADYSQCMVYPNDERDRFIQQKVRQGKCVVIGGFGGLVHLLLPQGEETLLRSCFGEDALINP